MTLSTRSKVCLLFLAAIFSGAAHAQIQWGIKGGFNVAEILTGSNQSVYVKGEPMGVRNYSRTDFHAGFLLSIPLVKKWSFQPELTYSEQGATAKPSGGYLVSATETNKINYINVPLLIKYNMPTGLFLETGPQVGYLISAKITEQVVGAPSNTNYHVKDQFKTLDYGWILAAGYLSPIDLGFDIRYFQGLNNINNASASSAQTQPVQQGNIKNSVVQVGVFYLFGKSKNKEKQKENN